MEIYREWSELLGLFNEEQIDYLIVGGHALAFHGAPRFTGDLDILVRPDSENAAKVIKALAEFGFSFPNLTAEDFASPDQVVQLGVPPMRVDLITSLSGVTWDEASAGKVAGKFGNVPVDFLGRDQFIATKRATGRKKDLADIEALGE
ncbi:MAG: hypothetical protein KC994_00190 [Candidatus Omnitrophica bacterium]|nr:hypothetical protein [Candidatus Omnitrophota bacterium]